MLLLFSAERLSTSLRRSWSRSVGDGEVRLLLSLNRISSPLNMDPISLRISQYVVVKNKVLSISSLFAYPRIQYVNSQDEQHDCVLVTSGKAEPMQCIEKVFPSVRCLQNTHISHTKIDKKTCKMLLAKRNLCQTQAFFARVTLPVLNDKNFKWSLKERWELFTNKEFFWRLNEKWNIGMEMLLNS